MLESAAFAGPSGSDKNVPLPQLIIDKKNVYWIPDPTNPNNFLIKPRNICDLVDCH
jgi:hypothetical protein